MAHHHIKTEIIITATPEQVWQILTDFEDYPNWNPFITSLEGKMKVGNVIKVSAGGMSFEPRLLAYEPLKEVRWKGKLLVKGLFDGEHSFEIIDNLDGTTTLRHHEKFSGILVGLFRKKLDTDTRSGFVAMNEKLKDLAEK